MAIIDKVLGVHMKSYKGKIVPMQLIITTKDGQYFQSHDRIVAFIPSDPAQQTILDKKGWRVSKTTGKYRNVFLNETKQETERKVREGKYKLAELN